MRNLLYITDNIERARQRAMREDLIIAGWKRDRKIWAVLKAVFFFSAAFGVGMISEKLL